MDSEQKSLTQAIEKVAERIIREREETKNISKVNVEEKIKVVFEKDVKPGVSS